MVAILTDLQLVVRGDQFDLPMTYAEVNDTVINMTGWTITGRLHWPGGSIDLNVDNGGVVLTSLSTGQWKYRVSETLTATLPLNETVKLNVRVVDTLDDAKTLGIIWIKAIE